MPSHGTDPAPRQRLFFALWPDATVRSALDKTGEALLGKRTRRVPAANLHLTLAFAGAVTVPVRECLQVAAADIRCPVFDLRIAHVGHWPRPRISWLAPVQPPASLWSLAGALQAAQVDCGLQTETRPYQPHVTLARKISRPPAATCIEPIDWSIREFCLVESVTGPRAASYRVLTTWELEG